MKFYCDNCHAKYSISDEKVRGKILKVRCKKCAHVITVREPRAPEVRGPRPSASRPIPPPTPSRVAWYYAINGQSHGPYDEATLHAMIAQAEVGDAAYLWNQSYGETWKPVREVATFAAAMTQGERVRPSVRTLGVSGALEAVTIEDGAAGTERDEEEGVAPSTSSREDEAPFKEKGLNLRMEDLRAKLKKHKPNTAASAEAAAKEENSPELLDATEQVDASDLRARLGLEPLSYPESDAAQEQQEEVVDLFGPGVSAPVDMGAFDDDSFEFAESPSASSVSEGNEALTPGFEGLSAPDESVIDFSRIEKPVALPTDSGIFQESNFVVSEGDKRAESSTFAPSKSLLIQLDKIQKQGRGRRYIVGSVFVALFVILSGVAVVAASLSGPKEKINESNMVFDEGKKELVFKTYNKDERSAFTFELQVEEEVITAEEAEEAAAEEVVVAKVEPKSPVVKKAPESSSFEKAVASSNTVETEEKGLRTAGQQEKSGTIGSSAKVDTSARKRLDVGSEIRRPTASPGSLAERLKQRTGTKKEGPALGKGGLLSNEAAQRGFKRIRRSVASCHQRQVSRGLPIDAGKVHVTVEIQGSGEVTGLKLSPASFNHSEFSACMHQDQRLGRWKFDAYGGKTIKIKHTYVLE